MNKEYTNIDNLFKEKFENYSPEPPKEAWVNISNEISKGKGGGMFIKLSLIPFIAASLFVFFTYPHYEKNNKDYWNSEDQSSISVNEQNTIVDSSNNRAENESNMQTFGKTLFSKEGSISKKNIATNRKNNKTKSGFLNTLKKAFQKKNNHQAGSEVSNKCNEFTLNPIHYRKNIEFVKERKNTYIFNKPIVNIEVDKKTKKSNNHSFWDKDGEILVGFSWNPELVLYDESIQFGQNGQSVNQQHNFYFTGQYVKKNYFIESGIGYGKVVDRTSIKADYKKYLDSWKDIVSVSFDTNAVGDIEPIFHTETVKVYDSVNHVQYSDVQNSYDYIQVPLYIGRKQEVGRVKLTVKAGVIYSHIIHSVINQDEIQLAKNDVLVNTQIQVPQRNVSQLQFATGGGIEYQITEHLHFGFEVFYKKNINQSFSTERKISKPNSFGAKTGIYYKW